VHYNVISRLPCLLTRKPLMRHFTCAVILALIPTLAAAQEKTVVPPEKTATPPQNVKIEGMPPMPQSVLDGLSRYGQFRQALLQAWHPTKRQMVITTTLGTVPQLHYLDGPARDRRQLTWYANGVSRDFVSPSFDPTDPSAFVFQHSPDGSESRSLYRYDLATGEISQLVDSKTRFPHVWSLRPNAPARIGICTSSSLPIPGRSACSRRSKGRGAPRTGRRTGRRSW